jgi:choloylglycine hydrolase
MRTGVLFLIFLSLPFAGFSCTDFILKGKDGSFVVGRSLEFGQILPVQIQTFPRGDTHQSQAPNEEKGLFWVSKYAYIGVVLKPAQIVIDGMNEKGLSVGYLWMPGAIYPQPPVDAPAQALFFADISSYLLGNFATVDEAKKGLDEVRIYAGKVPGFPDIPPIHIAIHDAHGKNLAVEFLDGEMFLFDNPVGVLTNSPELPWHLTNLRNYINLSALNAGPIKLDGTVLDPTGQGSGLVGIPGDWTPPSRFVRCAIFKQALAPPRDVYAAIGAAFHILNTVDIPYGCVRSSKSDDYDFTQWVVVKDLKNKKLFYRTYNYQNIRMAHLTSSSNVIDLNIQAP